MNQEIEKYIKGLDVNSISEERKGLLQPLVDFISSESKVQSEIHLNFICTHNSRRSHLGQVWGKVLATYHGLHNISTYSGGTEVTAFNHNAVEALRSTGLEIEIAEEGNNPTYAIHYSDDESPIFSFSKLFSDAVPQGKGYAAIMTCSSADQGCPFIPEAKIRIPITYEDPKKSDGTGKEAEVYGEKCRQIATEMHFVMQKAKTLI